ncbi:lysophospholipid acyltransferase family protein [Methylobacterium tarhaniae]
MSVVTRIARSRAAQESLGLLGASYLKLVQRTNRFSLDPPAAYDWLSPLRPFIIAMWHGQHLMVPFVRRPEDRAATMVSRSTDGGVNTAVLERMGVRVIRGSGARRASDMWAKGGVQALRGCLKALEDGETVAFSADVPKVSRRCGEGIVMLARLSGRPVVPTAVVTSRYLQFDSWDRASLGLPFGRGVMAFGEPITVARDLDAGGIEAARLRIEADLNAVHARAFAQVGRIDPVHTRKGAPAR